MIKTIQKPTIIKFNLKEGREVFFKALETVLSKEQPFHVRVAKRKAFFDRMKQKGYSKRQIERAYKAIKK